MANYAPADARATLLFSRRRTPAGDLFDQLKFMRITFDADVPGEAESYWQPISAVSAYTDSLGNPFNGIPISNFEILDGSPKDASDTVVMQID